VNDAHHLAGLGELVAKGGLYASLAALKFNNA
jgi:hypothetical protein